MIKGKISTNIPGVSAPMFRRALIEARELAYEKLENMKEENKASSYGEIYTPNDISRMKGYIRTLEKITDASVMRDSNQLQEVAP